MKESERRVKRGNRAMDNPEGEMTVLAFVQCL
jgi:hypothetical protein